MSITEQTVFSYSDYREFIRHDIQHNREIRGYRSRLAEAAGFQRSFLSQVLNSHVALTPDHAARLCEFWNFELDETRYFLDLVHLSRSQTPGLRSHYQKELAGLRDKHQDLSRRIKRKTLTQDPGFEAVYYSAWYWSAIHIAVAIPKLRTLHDIANHLGLDSKLVANVLSELEEAGLIKRQKDRWNVTEEHLHLSKNSPLIVSHHCNWRQKAMSKIQNFELDGLHYSVTFGISRADREKLRQLLLETIDRFRALSEPSPSEELVCFLIDLFPL